MPPFEFSPAGRALFDFGGDALQQQREDSTEELRKKRMQAAQSRGYSPAGMVLASDGILGVPGIGG